MAFKALRIVLLGLRAADGSIKFKRSTSRAAKFGVRELSPAFLAFVATVMRIEFTPIALLCTDKIDIAIFPAH